MEYRFQVTAMDLEALLPQVCLALEKRTELVSRQRLPGMWKVTDHFRAKPRVSPEVSQKRRRREKLLGVLCLVLGIIAFVPGVMEPREWSLLLAGGVGIGAGTVSLLSGRTGRRNPYEQQARQLLAGKDRIAAGTAPQAVFSPEDMTLSGGDGQTRTVPYDAMTQVLECADILFVTYEEWATILQKKDLIEGTMEGLRELLTRRTSYLRCGPEDSLYGERGARE